MGDEALPEPGVGCFFLDVSMPAPIKFMIFSICWKEQTCNMKKYKIKHLYTWLKCQQLLMNDTEQQRSFNEILSVYINTPLNSKHALNFNLSLHHPTTANPITKQEQWSSGTGWGDRMESLPLLGVLGGRRAALQWWITSNSPTWTAVQWLTHHHSAKTQRGDKVNYNLEALETPTYWGLWAVL